MIDPKSLTSEERALLDMFVLLAARERRDEAALPHNFFQSCLLRLESFIKARRALFATPESEAKVCPNCGKTVGPGWDHEVHDEMSTCQPAQPEPAAPGEIPEAQPFLRDELSRLLNRHSRENHSDTPDFVLAGFLMDALCAWERATGERDTFFGQNPRFAAEVNGPERLQPEPAATANRIVTESKTVHPNLYAQVTPYIPEVKP